MLDSPSSLYQEALTVWTDGGWLMLPLFGLAIFMYYTALDLYLHLRLHFLLRSKVYRLSDQALETELSTKTLIGQYTRSQIILCFNNSSSYQTHASFIMGQPKEQFYLKVVTMVKSWIKQQIILIQFDSFRGQNKTNSVRTCEAKGVSK